MPASSSILIIVCLGLVGLAAQSLRRGRGSLHPFRVGSPEADAATLDALRRAGADLTKPIDIRFYLYFPTREQAERAGESSRNQVFVPTVEQGTGKQVWVCRVVAHVVPSESTIRDASIRLQAVAATVGGTYDGWDAMVRPASGGTAAPAPLAPLASPPVNVFIKWMVAARMYIAGPLTLLRTQRLAATDTTTLLSDAAAQALPEELVRYLADSEQALAAQGFAAPVRVASSPNANVTAYASLLEHRDGTALASAFVIRTTRGTTSATLTFRSELADGTVVLTSNSRIKRRFPRRRSYRSMSFPEIRDPGMLFDVHRFRAAAGSARPVRQVTRQPDPVAYQAAEGREMRDHWVRIGYYRRDADGTLRLTRRGAVCGVWRTKFPWAQLTDWRDGRARAAVLARYAGARRA